MTTPTYGSIFSAVLRPSGKEGNVSVAVGPTGRLGHMIPLDEGANQILVSWPCASGFVVNYRPRLSAAQITIANSGGASRSSVPITIVRQAGVEAGGGELWLYALEEQPGDENLRPTVQVINTGTQKY